VSSRRRLLARLLAIGVVVLLLWLPLYIEAFWLQTGLFAMSAAIGAIGLQLLVGVTGQLSLAHAFYLAVGAYGYCFLAGSDQPGIASAPSGLGLPTFLAMIGAVLFAGLLGALFSPIAGRLRGIYLGLASIGLVFIGQHVLFNAKGVTGGFNGRDAEPFSIFGFSFSNSDPDNLVVFGVPYGGLERLWYLGLLLVAISWWYAHNITRSRPGRALLTIRDSPIAAAVMGVNVPVYRAAAFTVSAMYAGLSGVLLALAFGRIVPDSFGFLLSIDFLVMIVVGGLGSIGGAVAGALLVSALPQIFDHYSASLPLMGDPGGGGLQPAEAARFVYGAAVVVVLIFLPDGLSAVSRRLAGRRRTASPLLPTDSKESTA
jgi:branched-chain amino acid transport system permease protein